MSATKHAEHGGVVLENLGAVMAAVDAANLSRLSDVSGVRKIIPIPHFVPLVAPLRYEIAPPAALIDGPLRALIQAGVPAFWDQDLRGEGITIGHFDTGINGSHPAFADLKAGGRNRFRYAAFDTNGDLIRGARARDTDFANCVHHGSHTAGTLVGRAVGGTQIGIAPDAKLVSVQIFPQPTPSQAQHDQLVVNALNWIVGERPHVLNLSFGDTRYNDSYLGIIQELIDQNIVVVAAVGNGGVDTSSSPGNYASVIGVGAVDADNRVCGFSGSAKVRRSVRPDLCAPGENVVSAGKADDFAISTGTSMAAPHVAGIVALIQQHRPELTPKQIKNLLKKKAYQPSDWDVGRGGAGIIDGKTLLSSL